MSFYDIILKGSALQIVIAVKGQNLEQILKDIDNILIVWKDTIIIENLKKYYQLNSSLRGYYYN